VESRGEVTSRAGVDRSRIDTRVAVAVSIAGIVFGLLARFFARPHSPLWLDENFSGAVAAAPNLAAYVRLVSMDVNGPLYYILLRPWSAVFGISDAGLRSLSLVLSAGAPLAVAIAPVRGLTRTERLTWAAMLALWIPGIGYAQSAKPLALAFFLATLQLLAFLNLLVRVKPTIRSAALWVGLSALAIEAHYDVAYIALAEGLVYLGVRRMAAVRTWPSLLLLLPVVIEIGRKLALLTHFTTPGLSWYALVQPSDFPYIAYYVVGGSAWLPTYPLLCLAFAFLGRNSEAAEWEDGTRALAWASLAGLIAVVAIVTVGAIRPTFTIRYLGPFAPPILLGVFLIFRRMARGERWVAYPVVVGLAGVLVAMWLAIGAPRPDSGVESLNIEQASNSLMRSGVREVAFTWDNPMTHGAPPDIGRAPAEFFFNRAHAKVAVTYVDVGGGEDPNRVLLQAAAPKGGAILWLYDKGVRGTAAIPYPPSIGALDPNYSCRQFELEHVGAVACVDTRVTRPLSP
jgi:hypothetical protein